MHLPLSEPRFVPIWMVFQVKLSKSRKTLHQAIPTGQNAIESRTLHQKPENKSLHYLTAGIWFSKHTFFGYSQIILDASAEIPQSKDTLIFTKPKTWPLESSGSPISPVTIDVRRTLLLWAQCWGPGWDSSVWSQHFQRRCTWYAVLWKIQTRSKDENYTHTQTHTHTHTHTHRVVSSRA